MKVPFADLSRLHEPILSALQAATERVIKSNAYILGKEAEAFEAAWSEYNDVKFALGCSNGTDALILALRALEIGPTDEVITASHTFWATVEAIATVGAKPVLIDVLDSNGLMDTDLLEDAITERTKAIIPVHLYGHPVDMDQVLSIAKRHNLYVVEDAAQAHGASYRGKKAGTFGDIGCFSFYPGKNLGALGDAGAILTEDEGLADVIRSLRDHGSHNKFHFPRWGANMRLDGLQAAYLTIKLPLLDQWNSDRRAVAAIYREGLKGNDTLQLLEEVGDIEHCYHLFVVRHPERNSLRDKLTEKGIAAGLHYPIPCHLQPLLEGQQANSTFTHSEAIANDCLSLPIFGAMTTKEAHHVVDVLNELTA